MGIIILWYIIYALSSTYTFAIAPTDISLSNTQISEGEPLGTIIGSLSTADPDISDVFIYELVGGDGANDNSFFSISGNQLQSNTVFDYNIKQTCSIRIRSSDSELMTYEKIFTIIIVNTNQTPINISLSSSGINENQPAGTIVGTLSTADPDAGDSYIYTLVPGAGDIDNSSFSIDGSSLRTNFSFDYEEKNTYSIRIRTTDNGGLSFEKTITIIIVNINELPSDIQLNPSSIKENKPANSSLGILRTIDEETMGGFTYSLVSGTGSDDNSNFTISGTTLRSNITFNYEVKSTYSIRVKSSVSESESIEKILTISILDSTDAPVISNIETTPLVFIEDSPPQNITSSIIISDEDSPNLQSISIQITDNYVSSEDSLTYSPVNGISVTYTNSGSITGSGNASISSYQVFARNVCYKNTNTTNPSQGQRTARFIVYDGSKSSQQANRYIQISRTNDAPSASNPIITGTGLNVGSTLRSQYTFTDPDGDSEGTSINKWFTSNSNTGINKVQINGATAKTYTTTVNEGGKYINYSVIPVDSKGMAGTAANSIFYYINAAPEFTDSLIVNTIHQGLFVANEVVTAKFPYYDKENDAAGTHEYQWYYSSTGNWSSALVIVGQTNASYTISSTFNNKYIAVKARPHASTGSTTGKEYRTGWYRVGELPSAVLSGISNLCNNGSYATLNVTLTGTPPWSITYKRNNNTPVTTNNINAENGNYKLSVKDTGTYKLVSMSDLNYNFGLVSGSGKVSYLPNPTARLTLSSLSICANDTTNYTIPVILTGTPPWNITYTVNGTNTKSLFITSPTKASIKVNYATKGVYAITQVTDANCTTTGTGETKVIEKLYPQAFLYGDTSVCPNDAAKLKVSLTGNGPWKLYYSRNSHFKDSVIINENLSSYDYIIKTTVPGIYRLTGVIDEDQAGCVSGNAMVTNYTLPSAAISGDISMCEGATGHAYLLLSGNSPWNIKYKLNGNKTFIVNSITQSTFPLPVYQPGVYTIDSVSDKYCKNKGTGIATVSTIKAPKVTISGLDTVYTRESLYVPISMVPAGGSYEKSDKAYALLYNNNTLYFWPAIADTADSPHWIRYEYQDTITSCYGKDSVRVSIIAKQGVIQLHNEIIDKQPKLCSNYDSLLIEGIKIGDPTPGIFTISGSEEAIRNIGNNAAYIFPSKIKTGTRMVTFSFYVSKILQQITRSFTFEQINGDFTWDNICFSETSNINLSDKSTHETESVLEHHYWNIKFPDAVKSYDSPNISIKFDQPETYPIEYIVISNFGCTDTVRKDIKLIPTYIPDQTAYFEDFAESVSEWVSHPLITDSLNSWTLGRPLGEIFDAPLGSRAWYTNVSNNKKGEQSYVISPCFNFTHSKKPMVKMNIWRAFTNAPELDGAVLQYSTNNGNTWINIGQEEDGINWYNSYEIEGSPGKQKIGWTSIQDSAWAECRYSLDNLIEKNNVQFRVAYGAPNRNFERDGFAFDNVWIGERTKKVLIEHFTNASSTACKDANEKINFLANKKAIDVIDLQYHLNYPGVDTFYTLNPFPPNSRELYYNILNVPFSLMDGGIGTNKYDYYISSPEEPDITLASLADNKFDLKVNTEFVGDMLDISVEIKALETISIRPITLYLVITESEIKGISGNNGETVFESVVRYMVPSSSGTTFDQSWTVNTTEYLTFDWDINNIFNTENIRVVAFLQDEITQEIYQASIDDPNIANGLKENIQNTDPNFLIYPNPASEITTIYYKSPIGANQILEITDNLGRVVWQGTVYAGEQQRNIQLNNFNAGIYTLRTIANNNPIESQKFIVLSKQ